MIDFTETNIGDIRDILITARKENKILQKDVATSLGIAKETISLQEKNITQREFSGLLRYIKAIGGKLYFTGNIVTDPVKYMEYANSQIEKYKSGEISANDALRNLSRKLGPPKP